MVSMDNRMDNRMDKKQRNLMNLQEQTALKSILKPLYSIIQRGIIP